MKVSEMKVEYVDHLGSDINVINAARVSFSKESKEFDEIKDAKLINYLAKHNHFTPLAHTAITLRFKAPIFMARQFVKHQIGMCLSADTEVTFVKKVKGSSNGTYKKSMQYIADMWFGKIKYQGGLKGKRNVSGSHIRVYNEETQRFEESRIVNVIDSGVKVVFEVKDSYGNTIKATKDHKFLTDSGWIKVKDLSLKNKLIRSDVGETFSYKGKRCNNPADVSARRNFRKSFKDLDYCDGCGELVEKECLVADHIIPVMQGGEHSLDNLQKLCKECDGVKTGIEKAGVGNTTLIPKFVDIISIVEVGEEQCYDISVDKIHNFLGNGFVVHNCWNEESRRYINDEPEFYIPKEYRGRPDNIKQGSEGLLDNSLDMYSLVYSQTESSLDAYNKLMEDGVAPEMARMVLPQNTMTNWVWSGSLVAFARVYKLRIDSHAQKEAQIIAEMIDEVVSPLYPVSWKALLNN